MAGWVDRIMGRTPTSANQAKERLKLVLINDRTDLSPQALEGLKNEIMQVISRYIDIDPATVSISMTQEGREQRLVADFPDTDGGKLVGHLVQGDLMELAGLEELLRRLHDPMFLVRGHGATPD